ncbi:MAG: hypothetical protein JXL67_01130 [Calditrichaeota bacterium]|nr:hypothetical protein [Calditrichota bacterium]
MLARHVTAGVKSSNQLSFPREPVWRRTGLTPDKPVLPAGHCPGCYKFSGMALQEAENLNLDFRCVLDRLHLLKLSGDFSRIEDSREFLSGKQEDTIVEQTEQERS